MRALLLAATLTPVPAAFAQQDDAARLDTVQVIGVTPLHGAGAALDKFPANVQSASGQQLDDQLGLDITEFMNRNFASVFLNEAQNNPLQADVLFRGFVASPLLGLPQGLSVFQDGVRLNEPFGDTVNWALIPDSAIASIDLIPGSNPIFGRNSLGGAIALRTRNGFDHPGLRGELSAGSFSRTVAGLEAGGVLDAGQHTSYYLNAWYLDEDGWRDYSPSATARVFANVGWRGVSSELNLDLTYAETDLIGNGPAPVQLIATDRDAIFTRPDRTENRLAMLGLRGSHTLGAGVGFEWNAYHRASDVDTLNGDDSDFEECELPSNAGLLCRESEREPSQGELDEPGLEENDDEAVAVDQFGNPIPVSDDLLGAIVNRTRTDQTSVGASAQLTFQHSLGDRSNELIFGADLERGDVAFDASTELGSLDPTRLAVPGGVLLGEEFTALTAETRSYGAFFSDTLALSPDLAVVLSGRWSRTEITLRDQLGTALNGDHVFERFNPAAGVTYRLASSAQLYAGYFESNRIPSPVELTCADEQAPCRLPNAFLADPPLEQVVARTWELGVRGRWNRGDWHAGLFHGTNDDDILFVSAGPLTNQGFFDNVGRTRRQGLELSVSGSSAGGRWSWFANYTHLQAQFRENFVVASVNHPLAADGEIAVQSGDRLPGVPEDLLKAGARFAPSSRWSVSGEALYSSSRVLRGDEGNLLAPVKGSWVLNLRGEYRVNDYLSLFLKIDNALDERYESFGLLGDASDVLGGAFDDPRFVSPAAPRAAWLGARFGR